VATVQLGGIPADAAAGFGSLWVTDYRGAVLRVDPVTRQVQRRVPLAGTASSIVVDRAAVWVMTEAGVIGTAAHLNRIDPASGRITARVPFVTFDAALASDGDAVWMLARHSESPWVKRVDPASGRPVASARTDAGVTGVAAAAAGDSIWTLDARGTITQRDSGAGGLVQRLAGRGDLGTGENGLVADARGAWVVSPARGAILRIEGGRVVRRIPVGPGTGPALARSPGALWVTAEAERPARYRLERLDEDTGAVTASLAIGTERPKSLVPTSGGVWVIGSAGTARLVRRG
jgi:streptogramin lyase